MKSRDYELFIKALIEKISSEDGDRISEIAHDVKMVGATRTWQIDLSYSFTITRFKCKVLVECKDWNKTIDVNVVSKIADCVRDCGANLGAIATTKGFTKGAVAAARKLGIGLLIVSDDKEPEWSNFTGKYLSFEDANATVNWFTDSNELKLFSGIITPKVNILDYIENNGGRLLRQLVETGNILIIDGYTKDQLKSIDSELSTIWHQYVMKETLGLPLELDFPKRYKENYYNVHSNIFNITWMDDFEG